MEQQDAPELKRRLAARLRALREERDLTQEALAYSGDVVQSKSYLSELEAAKKLPSLTALADLANRLGVEPFDLLVDPIASRREALVDLSRTADAAAVEAAIALLRGRPTRKR